MEKCPICSKKELVEKYRLNDYRITKEEFILLQCANCNFILTDNPPTPQNISKYYESEDYLEHSNKKEGLFSRLYNIARQIMLSYKYRIVKNISKKKNLLDIGAGSGQFLNFMRSKNYQVDGVELSEKGRAYSKNKFGLNIKSAESLYDAKSMRTYDIITLWHVLEHLYDLDKVAKRLDQLLTANGQLIIAVPNHKSYDAAYYKKYWAAWDVPRHLWHFSPKSIKFLFEKHGFELKNMKSMPFDPFFNALLSAKYQYGESILNLFRMIYIGVIAFLVGMFDTRKASSIIYILSKKN